MDKKLTQWISRNNNKRILISFVTPKTPTKVKNERCIKKFNLKPFLDRNLIVGLNTNERKGKLYVLTDKAKRFLDISVSNENLDNDYNLIGWILGSPRQRYVVLKTLSINSGRRTSEEIRGKASKLNPCMSRISTKNILKELVDRGLVETEIGKDRKRYYWINSTGKSIEKRL